MDVGIRELKARLSHYVRVAREGERILITDRGRPVAVLSPPPIEEVDDLPDALR
ncbi:MAG: type II toxin-antitoxin system prevent-host-death family antitoxin, partial [Candidatus Nanopelagicales bacterium]|nr:type II toxin-antitoxin system prevent-host-death family antitoxin [Candidatus Nanopelagicales bacterium]